MLDDLKNYRSDEDSFSLISPDAAVYLLVIVGFCVTAFRGYL